ncbi:MAG: efflux RND transporter periplasmic adaptor subunit [Alphaproteobacteria bacterium]|nr:efflux RND transporter periplasmic adaptor subunit [Alphaproteobacteria bacterium]MCB9691677.1 efflux RND transporter periplasmic adaptor subunit [Alphaproteobacteria bacterium]
MITLALLACGHGTSDTHAPTASLDSRVGWVAVQPPERVPVATLPAEIVPAPGAVHEVGPAVEGRLVRWLVAPGDAVVAGDPLAELVSPELAGLESQSRELAVAVQEQEKLVALEEAAAARGVASAAQLGRSRADLAAARASLDAVRQRLGAHRDTSTREGAGWTWRSPTTGVVGEVTCPLGTVDAARTCLSLVQPGGVVLEVGVPERLLGRLDGPTQARFTGADGKVFDFGEVSRAPTVDARSRSRRFRYAVVGGDAPLAGSSGRARIAVDPDEGTWTVPSAAITRIDAVPTVFVRREGGPEPRTVELLGREGDTVVLAGLQADDEVAVRGVYLLKSLALQEEG